MDKLRQARREHAAKTGTLKERKRNEMETYFDKIADNTDPSITDVDIVGESIECFGSLICSSEFVIVQELIMLSSK
jgi:hypothetical protein